jgi:hypothetical protein
VKKKRFVPYRYRVKMIGKVVQATGCCGMGDGVEVVGVLKRISPYSEVEVTRHWKGKQSKQLYEVNCHSLRELRITNTGIEL